MKRKLQAFMAIIFLSSKIFASNYCNECIPGCEMCYGVWFEPMAVKPCQMNLQFAELFANPSSTESNNSDHFLHPSWSFGFRIGAGVQSRCSPWFFKAQYTYWRNETNSSVTLIGTGIVGPSGITRIEPQIADTQNREILLPILGEIGKVSTKLKYNYNVLDVVGGRICCACQNLEVTPFGGFRGFWYSTKIREISLDSAGLSFSAAGDPSTASNNYSAYGIMGGLRLDYALFSCLSFYGRFGGSIVAGNNDNSRHFLTTGTISPANITYDESICLFIHSLEGAFGVLYDTYFCGCSVFVGLGYEVIQWAEVLPHPFRQTSISPGSATKVSNGLFLQAITASIGLSF